MTEQDYRHTGGNECEIIEELLSAFYDEELNDTSDAFVRKHLDSCPSCTTKLDQLKATVLGINSLPTEGTPERDLWPGIVAGASNSAVAVPLGAGHRGHWWKKTPMLIAAGVAALLIPAGAFVTGMALTRARHVPAPPVAPEPDVAFELHGLEQTIADAVRMATEVAEAAAVGAVRGTGEGGARLDLLMDVLVNDENAETRKMAAQGLGEIEDPRAVAALSQALMNDYDNEVRRWAAWALGEIEDPNGIPALSHALRNDTYGPARRWSAWALGEIEDPRGIAALVHTLQSDDYSEARRWAAWALGEIEDPRGIDGLANALQNDDHSETRRWAAWALGEIEDPRGVAPLAYALLNDDHNETLTS
jgi:hypothetical protein